MEQSAEKRGYLLEDYRVFHLNDAQGTRTDYHFHEFYKIVALRSGSGGYCIEDRRFLLETGDVVLIPGRCVHRPEFDSGMPYERTIIYIDPAFLMENSTLNCDLMQAFPEGGLVLRPQSDAVNKLFRLVDELENELNTDDYGQEILCRSALLRLLIQLIRLRKDPQRFSPKSEVRATGRIREIQRYLDTHLEESVSIDVLAERFYISKYHMMRQFREQTGQSVHAYLTERRLFLARERIRQGMSATDSCFQSGFGSYSAFVRAYTRRFGTTPTGRHDLFVRREETFE